MSERSSKGCLVAAIIWIFILGGISVAAKFFILPYFADDLAQKTGSGSHYRQTVTVAADSFSGYAVLRSEKMKGLLADKGIRLIVEDDQADYPARMKQLERQNVQMAVFTVDSFITSGLRLGRFPASIVAVIDESRGADALVAYKSGLQNIQKLNNPEAKIELTPASPSEFLARSVLARFNLPKLAAGWKVERDGAQEVYESFRRADKSKPVAYAMWEPYVSLALKERGAHVLLDSSKLSGHIIDVLVAERHFLRDQPEVVGDVLRAYFTALNYYAASSGGMESLILSDAAAGGGMKITNEQAKQLARGIQWKNTLQNYSAMNIERSAILEPLLEDGINNVLDVLADTEAVSSEDELRGQVGTWFYATPLSEMSKAGFHPDSLVGTGKGLGELKALSEQEWDALVPVGEMKVKPITFGRGTARIHLQGKREIAKMARTLRSLPGYYLKVYGNTRNDGDRAANQKLAAERAQAVYGQLLNNGVDSRRIKKENGSLKLAGGAGQSVTFELVQKPF